MPMIERMARQIKNPQQLAQVLAQAESRLRVGVLEALLPYLPAALRAWAWNLEPDEIETEAEAQTEARR